MSWLFGLSVGLLDVEEEDETKLEGEEEGRGLIHGEGLGWKIVKLLAVLPLSLWALLLTPYGKLFESKCNIICELNMVKYISLPFHSSQIQQIGRYVIRFPALLYQHSFQTLCVKLEV
jgi:hypothetical protein